MILPKVIVATFLTYILLFLTGCLEHTFKINVFNESNIELQYSGRGDRLDWDDDGQLLPDSTLWNLVRTIEEKEDETIHVIQGSLNIDSLALLSNFWNWNNTQDDTSHLQRSFNVSTNSSLFGRYWIFEGKLKNRNFLNLYGDIWDFVPEECRVLENDELLSDLSTDEIEQLEQKFSIGVLQWNLARYANNFHRVWLKAQNAHKSLPDTSTIEYSIAHSGWRDDLHIYLNQLDVSSPKTVNLDWWEDLRSVFIGRMFDITGPAHIYEIKSIADSFEREYQISKDVEDDTYNILIKLPGKTLGGNGEKGDDGWYSWSFNGNTLLNEDATLTLKSFELSLTRVAIAAFVLILLLNLIKRRKRKSQ